MEINFKELKRKDLQRLCKKHGLRANATNSQMADSLVSYFKIYEKNKKVNFRSKGLGGRRNSKVERVEGDAEKVIIVIDEDEDEHGSVLQRENRKSSPKTRCSSEKDEQIEARLDDSSECGDSKGTSMKWQEENAIIVLDEEDDKPCAVIKRAYRKNSRRSIRRVGKASEANRSNEENQAVGVLRNPKEGFLVPVRTARSRSMNSAVALSPVVEKAKARKERLIAGQNAELPLGTNEGEDNEIGKMKENSSLLMAVGDARVKRKRNSRNSSMKVNDEIMASLPIEVSVSQNFVGDMVYKKHVNTGMGSDITFSIDGEQARQGRTTRNEQEIEEHELSTSSNLMEVVAGSVQTKRGKKRTRAGLGEDCPVMEKEIDKLGSAHHLELSHRDEMSEPEACFGLSQTFGSPSSFNLASSRPCSLLSELQGGEDGGQFPVNNEQLSKQSGSLDRNGDFEMKESLVCKNSILASITMVVVDDAFVGRLSISELDHVSKDVEASKKSSATALSYSQGRCDIKECFCSSSENHVRNLEDSCNKCFNNEAHHNRCCAETPVSMNNLSSSSEQNCETLKFAGEVTGVEATQKCQDFEEVRDSEEEKKRNTLSKDHKEKENGENDSERITRHCDFENASPVILHDESMIEDIRDIAAPASERTDEMTNSALLSVNIDGHNDQYLFYLAESNSERVEESQIVVQKQVRDFKTLFDGCGASSEDNSSNELEYFAETLEKPGLGLLSCKFQEQAADYGQAAITRTMKIETDSSDMRNKLELQELIISRNLEASRNTRTEEKIDSCQVFEVEQESKASQSSGKKIIDPQDLIVSHITDVSTIVCDHLACLEFDVKGAEGIKEGDSSENRSASPNRKMLSDCKALLDTEEMEDVKFLKTKPSHGEPIETQDDKLKENESNLSPNGRGEKKNTTNFKEFESFKKFPDSPRLAESNSGQFFAPSESVVFREEHQIKGRPFKLEGNVQITQDKFKHDGEKICGSENRQATGYDEDLKGKNFAVSPPAKVEEIAPFGLSKRVDNLMEKLFCLKKVLRGEMSPLITDSSLPREEKISCEDSHPTRKKEMTSGEPFSAREQESHVLNAFTYTDPVNEGCEQDSSNSEVNILNKFDQVATTSSPLALKGNPELWKGMKSCEGNDTDEASPYECSIYIRSTEEGTCPDGDVDVKEFLETVQGVTAEPREVLVDNNFVSPGKLSSFDLEAESSIGSCFSKSKVNNSITNSPAIYVNPFGTKCLSETSVVHSSLPNKQANATHTVDILKMEYHDKVAKTTLSDALEGNLELWKCLEKCEANNTNAASSYESDCSYNGHAEAEPCQGGDINVRDFLVNAQGATSKPSEALEKIYVVSPSKQSRIHLVSERNSSASCSPVKFKLNNSITNSPAKDTKHFRNHCLAEALDGQTSLIIKEALATHTVDALKTESFEVAITSLPDALEEKLEFLEGMESVVANNINASFPYECDFTYNWHVDEEPCKGDDMAIREFLKIDQGATTRPGDVLAKIKLLSPSTRSSIDLEDERNFSASCISKKDKLNSNLTNSPARDIKHFGAECFDETLNGHSSLPTKQAYAKHPVDILILESQDDSIHGADTLVDPIPSEVKASFNNNSKDPLEQISHKSDNFCISSRKFAKFNILNTPTAHSAGISSVGLIRDKIKYSSKRKIRSSASAGSIRRPLQSITNQMNE